MDYSNVLLIMDMDGTLLSSSGEMAYLSNENRDLIEYFILKGGTFSVASGRNMQNAFSSLNHLRVNFPYTLINGALRVRCDSKTTVETKEVPIDFLKDAFSFYKSYEKDIAFVVADEYKMYGMNKNENKSINHGFYWQMIDEAEIEGIKPLKLAFAFDESLADEIYGGLNNLKSSDQVKLIQSSPYFIEIVAKDVSKGQAIRDNIDYMQMSDKTLVCIGDYLNDESMLDIADYAYVVSNAHPLLKEKFKVLKSNHDGCIMDEVLKIIDKI